MFFSSKIEVYEIFYLIIDYFWGYLLKNMFFLTLQLFSAKEHNQSLVQKQQLTTFDVREKKCQIRTKTWIWKTQKMLSLRSSAERATLSPGGARLRITQVSPATKSLGQVINSSPTSITCETIIQLPCRSCWPIGIPTNCWFFFF